MCVCARVCVWMYVCVCTYVWMYVCVCVCVFFWGGEGACVDVHMHIASVCTQVYAHAYVRVYGYMRETESS